MDTVLMVYAQMLIDHIGGMLNIRSGVPGLVTLWLLLNIKYH